MNLRAFAGVAACLLIGNALAQAPDAAWPRERKAADGSLVTVYQPQVETWKDNRLTGRAAIAVLRPGEQEPQFGVIELEARADVDKEADVATLRAVRIVKGSFPGLPQAQADQYLAKLRAALPKDGWPVSVKSLQANLAITQARSKGKPVKNDPPAVLFRRSPTLLVLVDGEPARREAKGLTGIERVINTQALIAYQPASSLYYMWALGRWWQAKEVTGEWTAAASPPGDLEYLRASLTDRYDPVDGKKEDGKPVFGEGVVPQLVVATKPTELLQSNGDPQFSPIPGTQLLYMSNSPNDIFNHLASQQYFVLISGRWFASKSLNGPWTHVAGKSLPADFARIPPEHAAADVLVSVPNTQQAREAVVANEIPQTAQVSRDLQPTPVAYDGGDPQWKPIDGTPLSYAYNTAAPVIRVDAKSYYMVQNGVWFSATAFTGPWVVATAVPSVIYTIPTSSPLHYVTYVRIYSSTASVVYVGYTPGYYGTVVTSDGVVVYGTGYYYPPYIGTYWYPPPVTYGYGAGFATGVFFISFAIIATRPWYGPCCYGGGIHVSFHNTYNRWGGGSTITGGGGRPRVEHRGDTTFAKGRGSDNVYAGRDGNVYRREGAGDWQKYNGAGNWSDLDRPGAGARPEQRPAGGASTRDAPRAGTHDVPRETPRSLDRSYGARQGAAGGGMRGGGARGGRR